jgi:hypothetical protein
MKIKSLESLLTELKKREIKESNLDLNGSITKAKEELLDKISQIYNIKLSEVKIKYSEIKIE